MVNEPPVHQLPHISPWKRGPPIWFHDYDMAQPLSNPMVFIFQLVMNRGRLCQMCGWWFHDRYELYRLTINTHRWHFWLYCSHEDTRPSRLQEHYAKVHPDMPTESLDNWLYRSEHEPIILTALIRPVTFPTPEGYSTFQEMDIMPPWDYIPTPCLDLGQQISPWRQVDEVVIEEPPVTWDMEEQVVSLKAAGPTEVSKVKISLEEYRSQATATDQKEAVSAVDNLLHGTGNLMDEIYLLSDRSVSECRDGDGWSHFHQPQWSENHQHFAGEGCCWWCGDVEDHGCPHKGPKGLDSGAAWANARQVQAAAFSHCVTGTAFLWGWDTGRFPTTVQPFHSPCGPWATDDPLEPVYFPCGTNDPLKPAPFPVPRMIPRSQVSSSLSQTPSTVACEPPMFSQPHCAPLRPMSHRVSPWTSHILLQPLSHLRSLRASPPPPWTGLLPLWPLSHQWHPCPIALPPVQQFS